MYKTRDFDVVRVGLEGKNLIEASAGTGKTYSIAILVLRMIIEKKIPIEKILMVTFTKAAVAELESRIRKFVRKAYKYSMNIEIDDQLIKKIIDNAGTERSGEYLGKASQSLDKLSVMTIHSFCERSLMQYPFETSQPFRFEIATDISEIRDLVVDDYWRRKINTMDKDLFKHFTELLTRDMIRQVLSKALEGKEYLCGEINESEILKKIKDNIQMTETAWNAFENHVRNNFTEITSRALTNYAKKFLEENSNSPVKFIDSYLAGYNKKTIYIQNSFPKEYDLCSEYYRQKETLEEISGQYIYHFFNLAIDDLKSKVTKSKSDRKVIDFNDQIMLLHQAVKKGNLNNDLSKEYDAVFIDEFQDTDKHQYEIFSSVFSEKTLFYIGDPKQSIYGWRKADIETYKRAKEQVDVTYTMNRNFRSTEELINALNDFFSIENPFADPQIGYNRVDSGLGSLGALTINKTAIAPLDIFGFKNKKDIEQFIVAEIYRILTSKAIEINDKPISPSDIAVIVRTNKEGRAIKKALSKANVPAITIDDTKVMSSEEAMVIQYLMEAVIRPNRGALNRVLLKPCFGVDSESIKLLDDEQNLERFRELKQIWHESGIYNMLFRFFDLYRVRKNSLCMGIEGQRILTNLYQIAEILHNKESKSKYTPTEMLVWCQRVQNENNADYEQRVESQDNAVKITTIHKCKGLTYNIVFAPYLDLVINEYPIYDFRKDGEYFFSHQPSEDQKRLWLDQTEQENCRLIYVALTRARYKVYVCINNSSYNAGSSIKKFPVHDQKEWKRENEMTRENNELVVSAADQFSPRPIPGILIQNKFGIHSFSALSRVHASVPFEKAVLSREQNYDQFVFQDLGRGASVGTALHSIFERLDFCDPGSWNQTLIDASKYYSNIINAEIFEGNQEGNHGLFKKMVSHVMSTEIPFVEKEFRLKKVTNDHKLSEMEFYFSLNSVNKTIINEVLGEEADLSGEADIQGLMTGFIDLVFEHNGKYYILDWKSNHLGNSIENYNQDSLVKAMKESNYNLQYLIYTVAVKRWLENKIKDFDYDQHFGGVIYLFLRGVRDNQATGKYCVKPSFGIIEKLDRKLTG